MEFESQMKSTESLRSLQKIRSRTALLQKLFFFKEKGMFPGAHRTVTERIYVT